jgi:hypothetical protein
MAQAVGRWPVTMEALVSPCEIFGGQDGTGGGVSLTSSVLLR